MPMPLRSLLLGGAATLAACSLLPGIAQAQVQDNFYGGGSSLAGPTYGAEGMAYFDNNETLNLQYETSSSGNGTSAFIANQDCLNYTKQGLTCAVPAATPSYVAASDAYLSASNYAALICPASPNPGVTNVVQIPMFATPVAIAFNIPSSTSTSFLTDGSVVLNDNDLGLIFSGQVTNWDSPMLSQNQSTTLTHLPNLAITVVYRSDGSGTSFLTTTHLAQLVQAGTSNSPGTFGTANFAQGGAYPFQVPAATCAALNPITAPATWVNPQVAQTGTTTFITVFPGSTPPSTANFQGKSGSAAVEAYILSTAGAIGYLSPDYTDIAMNNGAGVPTSPVSFPPVAALVNSNGGAVVLPTGGNAAAALAGVGVPSSTAQLQNPENFAPIVPTPPAGAYPISGYTYWFLDQCYNSVSPNPARNTDIVNFLSSYFTGGEYKQIVSNAGFASLSTGSGLGKAVKNNILAASAAEIDIGDSTICPAGTGR